MKKLFALVLVVAMSLVSVAAFAAADGNVTGAVGSSFGNSAAITISPDVNVYAPGYVDVEIIKDENPVLTFNKVYPVVDAGTYILSAPKSVGFTVQNKSTAGEGNGTWTGSIYVTSSLQSAPTTSQGVIVNFTPIASTGIDIGGSGTCTLTYGIGPEVAAQPDPADLIAIVKFEISTTATP